MGIYFIAAGISSKNRLRTLDRSWTLSQISPFLPPTSVDSLRKYFPDGDGIYAWGANSEKEISKVNSGEYVVDVKNKEIVQIFQFCFCHKTQHTRLQELFEWDGEKPSYKRRHYLYVYFLSNPMRTLRRHKSFFARAFGLEDNPQWLIAQKYFSDADVENALLRTKSNTVRELLGLSGEVNVHMPVPPPISAPSQYDTVKTKDEIREPVNNTQKARPSWLNHVIEQVEALKVDPGHLERDHEDIVANLFETLGYRRIIDIKFRRGNIDIRIDRDGKPLFTVEVKAEWSLTCNSTSVINQAYAYANEIGSRYVVITNGDLYCVFDRSSGLKYQDQLIGSFMLSSLRDEDLELLDLMRK